MSEPVQLRAEPVQTVQEPPDPRALIGTGLRRSIRRVRILTGCLALSIAIGLVFLLWAPRFETGVVACGFAAVGFALSIVCALAELKRLREFGQQVGQAPLALVERTQLLRAISIRPFSFEEGLFAISRAVRLTAPTHAKASRAAAAQGVQLPAPHLWTRMLPVAAAACYLIAGVAGFVQLTAGPHGSVQEGVSSVSPADGPPDGEPLLAKPLDITQPGPRYTLDTQVNGPTAPTWTVELAQPLPGYRCALEKILSWPSNVAAADGSATLSSDFKQVVVSSRGNLAPGDYTSTLTFKDPAGKTTSLKLTLSLFGPHQVAAKSGTVNEAICSSSLDGWFPMFVAASSTGPHFWVPVDNGSRSVVEPSSETVYVTESNGATHPVPNTPQRIPLGVSAVPVDVSPLNLGPGTYTGTVGLQFARPIESVSVPFTLDVRDSPWRAIVLFLAACGIGLAARWSNSTQNKYQDQLATIEASISGLTPPNQPKLQPAVDQLEFRIENTPEDPNIATDLTTLQNAADMVRAVEALEKLKPDDLIGGQSTQWDEVVKTALRAAEGMDLATATVSVGMLKSYIESESKIPIATSVAAPAPAEPGAEPVATPPAPAPAAIAAAMGAIAHIGHSAASARSRERLNPARSVDELRSRHMRLLAIRAGISTVATLLLAVLAMKTLYLPGFGHSILDYAAVLASGFGAGVAGKGLSTSLTAQSFA